MHHEIQFSIMYSIANIPINLTQISRSYWESCGKADVHGYQYWRWNLFDLETSRMDDRDLVGQRRGRRTYRCNHTVLAHWISRAMIRFGIGNIV